MLYTISLPKNLQIDMSSPVFAPPTVPRFLPLQAFLRETAFTHGDCMAMLSPPSNVNLKATS
jgi:hypothetical protein